MPPFLPKTFTFSKFDTFTGLTQSQFHISPKTFTFFKSNVMTIFKGFTPTLLVFLKSFLSDFLFPEFIFAGFTQFCWPPDFQRPKTEKLQALVICTRQDVLKRKLSRKIKYLVDMHFQKRKRQSLGNKTFLQKKGHVSWWQWQRPFPVIPFLFTKYYKCNFLIKMKIIILASSTF